MLYLLVGEDAYARDEYLQKQEKHLGLPRVDFVFADTTVTAELLVSQDLFAPAQMVVVFGGAEVLLTPEQILQFSAAQNHIFVVEAALDMRTKFAKTITADKHVQTVKFTSPDVATLPQWVVEYATKHGGSIRTPAAQTLLGRLGYIDPLGGSAAALREPSLGVLEQELQKLLTFANKAEITAATVAQLVPDDRQVVTFAITDAITQKNRVLLMELLGRYYNSSGEDDTTKTITLAALLAEQLRACLQVVAAQELRMRDEELLAQTGWKSGRLFMVKKQAAKLNKKLIKDTLSKLESLDLELKSSTMPPRVMLELIVVQMM